MRSRALVATAVALLGSCTVGAPPGFSDGNQWTIPLIGPLEDGLLLVPALVNDRGPYVFAIDPDAHVSIIDREVVDEVKPRTGEGPKMLDETDTQQNRFYGEILKWQVGTLTVQGPKSAQIVAKGTFDADGRRIHGVLGRDIIADSLVFGFDREAGVITLATQKGFSAPPGSTALKYSKLHSQVQNAQVLPIARKLVTATIGAQRFAMHLDLGAHTSQLRSRSWTKANLVAKDAPIGVVDEAGMPRLLKQQTIAPSVTVASLTANDVVFVPYTDKRWRDIDIEGTLGLGFFKAFNVTVNWDRDTFYVRPRGNIDNTVERIGRWQSKTLGACANPGCVKVTITDPLAGKPAEQMPPKHPGVVASIVREPSAKNLDIEVLIAVTAADGKAPLKWLVANLPGGTERAMTHLSADYVGATLTVLDASPFPRACPSDGACVDMLAAPRPYMPPAGATPAAPPPPEPVPAPTEPANPPADAPSPP